MNFKLSEDIYFGNWTSPIELKKEVKTIINVGHNFSERRGKRIYWDNLREIPWDVYYTRLAQKDHRVVTEEYFKTIENVVANALMMGKTPILCHCQMGGHRGPTVAIMVSWIMNNKKREHIDQMIDVVNEFRPKYARTIDFAYRKSMMDFMVKNSK